MRLKTKRLKWKMTVHSNWSSTTFPSIFSGSAWKVSTQCFRKTLSKFHFSFPHPGSVKTGFQRCWTWKRRKNRWSLRIYSGRWLTSVCFQCSSTRTWNFLRNIRDKFLTNMLLYLLHFYVVLNNFEPFFFNSRWGAAGSSICEEGAADRKRLGTSDLVSSRFLTNVL